MHIPDGFLDAKTAIASGGLAVAGVGVALWQAQRTLPARRVPLLGVTAAFIFAAQLLNFPVAGGTSGHLVGGVLAAVLVGPSAAVIVLTAVLLVQCFLFADGGVTALGANIFNMGLVNVVAGSAIYRILRRLVAGPRGLVLGAAFAGWCATVLAAVCCAGQLAWSGKVAWRLVFPAMAGVHMLIGIGEGAITALVLLAIVRVRPELVERNAVVPLPAATIGSGLLVALGLALFVSPFACVWPDGLEKVAAKLGFDQHTVTTLPSAPFRGYQLSWLGDSGWGTALVGAIGTLAAFLIAFFLARMLVPNSGTGVPPVNPSDTNRRDACPTN